MGGRGKGGQIGDRVGDGRRGANSKMQGYKDNDTHGILIRMNQVLSMLIKPISTFCICHHTELLNQLSG